jgi:hypothetical protein
MEILASGLERLGNVAKECVTALYFTYTQERLKVNVV